MESRGFWPRVRARLALLPEALRARRAGGRGLLAQACDIVRLRLGPTRLRAAEYYDFRLWRRDLTMAQRRAFSGAWHKNRIHRHLNNKAWEVLMTDKLAQSAYLRALGLPHAAVLAVASHPLRPFGDTPSFTDAESLASFLRGGIDYPFFVKPAKGMEGRCCYSVRAYEPASDALRLGDGRLVAVESFLEELVDPTGFGMTFLEHLESHPIVRAMCGETVSSVRMIVLLGDDGPQLLHADWAIPAGESMVSNFARGEAGNMIGGLDPQTGLVTAVLGGAGAERREIEVHPMTGVRMKGFRLPDWEGAVELCLRAARGFPGARWQNWDVALTDRGPVLLELNSAGDLYAAQYITGQGALDGPLAAFLERYVWPDDMPRRLYSRSLRSSSARTGQTTNASPTIP